LLPKAFHIVPSKYQKPTAPPVIAAFVLYTSNEVAGLDMVATSFIDVKETLGIKNPMLSALSSKRALGLGAVVPIPTFLSGACEYTFETKCPEQIIIKIRITAIFFVSPMWIEFIRK
jgi:hypothetical protein